MGKLAPYHGTYASARSASELLDIDTINAGCDEVDEKAGRLTEQANTIQTATANLDEKNFSVSQSTPQQKISETCSNINEVKNNILGTTASIRAKAEAEYNEIQQQFNYEAEQRDAYERNKNK